MVYFVSFFFAIAALYVTRKRPDKDIIKRFAYCIAILVPCFLAGLRANTIGTDIRVYAHPMFSLAASSQSLGAFLNGSFINGFIARQVSQIEIGFSLLIFICAKVFHSFKITLFVIQFLVVMPLLAGLCRLRNADTVWIGMTVYYFLYFGASLNIMRQWIAIAFLILGYTYLVEDRVGRYAIYSIIGIAFHLSSVLVSIIIFLIWFVFKRNASHRQKNIRLLLVLIGCSVLLIFIDKISPMLASVGFEQYTAGYAHGSLFFSQKQILIRLPIIIICLLLCFFVTNEKIEKKISLEYFYIAMVGLDTIFSQFGSLNRMTFYFGAFQILFYPFILNLSFVKKNRNIVSTGFIVYVIVYFLIYYVSLGYCEVYPYVLSK